MIELELVSMAKQKRNDDGVAACVVRWNCKTEELSLWSYGNNTHCFFHVSLRDWQDRIKKKTPSNTMSSAFSINQANWLL